MKSIHGCCVRAMWYPIAKVAKCRCGRDMSTPPYANDEAWFLEAIGHVASPKLAD